MMRYFDLFPFKTAFLLYVSNVKFNGVPALLVLLWNCIMGYFTTITILGEMGLGHMCPSSPFLWDIYVLIDRNMKTFYEQNKTNIYTNELKVH